MEVKIIKVVIGTHAVDGRRSAAYPDFNLLDIVKESKMDWAYYVDDNGGGWHYDKCCDHSTEAPGSPVGVQFGMLCVPPAFADQAMRMFPGVVVPMSEADAETFYNDHAHAHESDELVNASILNGIAAKNAAGVTLTNQDVLAMNASDPTPGITKNTTKTWKGYKEKLGLNVQEPLR